MFFIIAASSAANVCGIIRISSAEDTLTLKRLSTHHNRPSDTVEIPLECYLPFTSGLRERYVKRLRRTENVRWTRSKCAARVSRADIEILNADDSETKAPPFLFKRRCKDIGMIDYV